MKKKLSSVPVIDFRTAFEASKVYEFTEQIDLVLALSKAVPPTKSRWFTDRVEMAYRVLGAATDEDKSRVVAADAAMLSCAPGGVISGYRAHVNGAAVIRIGFVPTKKADGILRGRWRDDCETQNLDVTRSWWKVLWTHGCEWAREIFPALYSLNVEPHFVTAVKHVRIEDAQAILNPDLEAAFQVWPEKLKERPLALDELQTAYIESKAKSIASI